MDNEESINRIANLVRNRSGENRLPINVNAIADKYAIVKRKQIPFDVDGISYCQQGNKNVIILNTNKPQTRRRFTLAHELGHIKIPWHTGIIVDTDCFDFYPKENNYPELESEANTFASELLLPEEITRPIVLKMIKDNYSEKEIVQEIAKEADLSFLATIIKISHLFSRDFAFLVTDENREVKYWSKNSKVMMVLPTKNKVFDMTLYGKAIIDEYSKNDFKFYFIKSGTTFNVRRGKNTGWRPVLEKILDDQNISDEDRLHNLQSINGIIGSAKNTYNKENEGKGFRRFYQLIYERFLGRKELAWFVEHSQFEEYLHLKANDLFSSIMK